MGLLTCKRPTTFLENCTAAETVPAQCESDKDRTKGRMTAKAKPQMQKPQTVELQLPW